MKNELEEFIEVRNKSDELDIGIYSPPKEICLGLRDENEGRRMQEVASGLWNNVFLENDITKILEEIEQNPLDHTLEIHRKLRMVRISGVIFRDANCLFSENHLIPYSFYNFVKVLGIFNDTFGTSMSEPSAANLLEIMKKSQEEMGNYKFTPCSPDSYKEYLKGEFNLISGYLEKGALSRESLHDLRRTNRRILNLLLLRTLNSKNLDSFELYAYLRKANSVLGISLDENPINLSDSEIEKPIEIPGLANGIITNFLNRVTWSVPS